MIDLLVIAGIVLAFLGLVTFLIVKLLSSNDATSAVLAKSAALTVRAERAEYELAAATKALAAELGRSVALEAYATDIEEGGNEDLDPSDIATRLRRLLSRPAEAGSAGDPVHPEPDGAVPSAAPTEELRGTGSNDLLRPE